MGFEKFISVLNPTRVLLKWARKANSESGIIILGVHSELWVLGATIYIEEIYSLVNGLLEGVKFKLAAGMLW